MPIIKESSYKKRPRFYFHAWMETLIPYYRNGKISPPYLRERLELADGDFLDLDWMDHSSRNLMIVSHGFEGNSRDHFIAELANQHLSADLLVWHYRSCSGELNRLPRFYHHGDIEDLHAVVKHAKERDYDNVFLIGFSMGGNLVINYLGDKRSSGMVSGGVVFSTPMDLKAASIKMRTGLNRWIEKSFVKKWKRKIERKAAMFPQQFDTAGLSEISTLEQLMERYVLPQTVFSDIASFYQKWSSGQYIASVNVPLLIVNAKNDPLLSENCYPCKQCEDHPMVFLEIPRYGGHTGFSRKVKEESWFVWRIKSFIAEHS